MKRSDYLKTIEGQLGLRRRRTISKLLFTLDGQEPRSKNAISELEKVAFQSAILNKMIKQRRRHFRSSVALEFVFSPTESNPPALHTMPKNYLDLLERPRPGLATRRKRIVFENDRQVSYLAATYLLPVEAARPGILLKASPYRDFLADIALLEKIEHDELRSVSSNSIHQRSSVFWEVLTEEVDVRQDCDAANKLREYEKNRQSWVSQLGEDAYEAFHEMYIRDLQNQILKTLALNPTKLISLLSPHFSKVPHMLNRVHGLIRDNLILRTTFAIDLKHSNLKEGESSQYKAFVKQTMASYREKHPVLFPLMTEIGITILYQPPASGGIDLDNLARRIVPFVNDELQPPSNLLLTINADRIGDFKLRQWYKEKQLAIKRMPKHSITHYQVIKLPRLTTDNKDGFVRLILEPGEHDSLLNKVQSIIYKWEDNIERS